MAWSHQRDVPGLERRARDRGRRRLLRHHGRLVQGGRCARRRTCCGKYKIGSGIVGQPICYRGPDGKQYVAVLSRASAAGPGKVVSSDLDVRDATGGNGLRQRDGATCRNTRQKGGHAVCVRAALSVPRVARRGARASRGRWRRARARRATFDRAAGASQRAGRAQRRDVPAGRGRRPRRRRCAGPCPTRRYTVEGNAYAVAQGKRLFRWYNCSGCHATGGGGDWGPALMDDKWIYGVAPAGHLRHHRAKAARTACRRSARTIPQDQVLAAGGLRAFACPAAAQRRRARPQRRHVDPGEPETRRKQETPRPPGERRWHAPLNRSRPAPPRCVAALHARGRRAPLRSSPLQDVLRPGGPQAAAFAGCGTSCWRSARSSSSRCWSPCVIALWRAPRARRHAPDLGLAGTQAEPGARRSVVSGGVRVDRAAAVPARRQRADRPRAGAACPLRRRGRPSQLTANQWWWEATLPERAVAGVHDGQRDPRAGGPPGDRRRSSATTSSTASGCRAWHGKKDLIPGHTATIEFRADKPGVYRGQCAEFCGYEHAWMAFEVIADPPDALRGLGRAPAPGARRSRADAAAQRGQQVFVSTTCAMCHAIEGTRRSAHARRPTSRTWRRAARSAPGTLPNTPRHLKRWIRDPQTFKPGVNMPATDLPDDDLDASSPTWRRCHDAPMPGRRELPAPAASTTCRPTPDAARRARAHLERPARPARLAVRHQPQDDRQALHRHRVRLLRAGRRAGAADARCSSRGPRTS